MWVCPKCERKLRSANQWHNCVKVDIDSLFEDKSINLVAVFDRLLSEIQDWEEVSISATKNCVVFLRRQTFLIIRPMKKQLDLKFYLPNFSEEFPIIKSTEYVGKYETHIRLSEPEEVDYTVIKLIKISYNL